MTNRDETHHRQVHTALNRALSGTTLPSEDYASVRTWINTELPQLQAAGYTSYIVFGSYRGDYHRSLRITQYELAKTTTATAVVLGDTPSLGLTVAHGRTDPVEFEITFHLLTEFADRNVGVYEKDSGGEAVELGLLRHDHCFAQTVALPRDYYGLGDYTFETKQKVLEIARHIAFADDLDDTERKAELRGLLTTAQQDGIELTEHALTEFLEEEIAARDADDPSYSWVHLALFRQFENANQCHTWHTESDLRETANNVTLDTPTRWNVDTDSDLLE